MKIFTSIALILAGTLGTGLYAAENEDIVFCNANVLPYNGKDLLLSVQRRGDSLYGQVIRLSLGLHSELASDSASVIYEEKVNQTSVGERVVFKGSLFDVSIDPKELMTYDSRNFADGNHLRTSDYAINGVNSSDLSQFSPNQPERFSQLNCRSGSYKARMANPLFHFFDDWGNDTF